MNVSQKGKPKIVVKCPECKTIFKTTKTKDIQCGNKNQDKRICGNRFDAKGHTIK